MIAELLFDAFVAAGMVILSLALRSVERILRLHDERLRLNTRRIWNLEGCPRGDVAEDLQ